MVKPSDISSTIKVWAGTLLKLIRLSEFKKNKKGDFLTHSVSRKVIRKSGLATLRLDCRRVNTNVLLADCGNDSKASVTTKIQLRFDHSSNFLAVL